MNNLVFCSYEVGGFPFGMADILNRHGHKTLYISLHHNAEGHNSDKFHHSNKLRSRFNISDEFIKNSDSEIELVKSLKGLYRKRNIRACLATGDRAYLLAEAGIPYTYWVFGSDLDQWAFCDDKSTREKNRRSISGASKVLIAPYQKELFRSLWPDKPLTFLPHFFDGLKPSNMSNIAEKKSVALKTLQPIIGADRFFFSSTRHVWDGTHRDMADNKGNDIIIISFAQYIKKSGDSATKLVLIAKGWDVEASRYLASELGISNRLIWLDEMQRDELSKYYTAAHLVFGQFGTPVLTYSALEPLLFGTPCISYYWGKDHGVPFYESQPPIYNFNNPEQIVEKMLQLVVDDNYYTDSSERAITWLIDNCSEESFVRHFQLAAEYENKQNSFLKMILAPKIFRNRL